MIRLIVAVDPGLSGLKVSKTGKKTGSNTGVAIFDNGKLITSYFINLKNEVSFRDKAKSLIDNLIFADHSVLVVEQGFYQGKANINHLKLMGVLDYVYGIETISPLSVKKIVTGSGRAEKSEVRIAVFNKLSMYERKIVLWDDEDCVDAIAVGMAYMIREKELCEQNKTK